jgi:NADPH-dependent 2,4-dienoyl-CoA reductase/sulfur reductase-like enzyme/nitrite reductase/ring-hydroxylating ferredoxin subunit
MGAGGTATGPDFSQGVRLADIPADGPLAGRVEDEPVLLSRLDGELFAVGGACTHYGAALACGLADGETIRCPLHHACFSLRTGAALRAPAFAPLDRWAVTVDRELVFVREKLAPAAAEPPPIPAAVGAVVIVGGGAAAFACAQRLRGLGHRGRLTMISADADPPCDRPNLSKDYLAGQAPEEWLPLHGTADYALRLGTDIAAIDIAGRRVLARTGEAFAFDRLLLATGAEPVRPAVRGLDRADVLTLRGVADARAIIARAAPAARAAIVGSGFIGLEVAAALRARDMEVAIVSADAIPFERSFGAEIGLFLQRLHERRGVAFHLGAAVSGFDGRRLGLVAGAAVEADFVILGTGVRPRLALAESAGLAVGDGILTDRYLATSAPGIYAAGDAAAYPDPLSGRPIRIEHWVTAERQGQVAAANMLGLATPFDAVPFFWTEQYGVALRHVGHAPRWDEVRIDGDVAGGDFTARYYEDGRFRAALSCGRDRESLADERLLEREIAGTSAPFRHPI